MQCSVIGAGHYSEVFWPVVKSVMVDVMYNLSWK